jgi:ornithine carbamoyltransferase
VTKKNDFLSIHDHPAEWLEEVLSLAARVKASPDEYGEALKRKTLAMLFEKPSLRTRVTFEAGMTQLGGHAIYLAPSDAGLGSRESVPDVARNLSRWVQGIFARTFAHRTVLDLAENATVPVINGLSDLLHPCQVAADLLTLKEQWGDLKGRTMAWVGDGNNVCNSLAYGCAKTGVNLRIATPPGYEPRADILEEARWDAEKTGARIDLSNDPAQAVYQADAIYTDTWASMGQEEEAAERRLIFEPFQVNAGLMGQARSSAFFLHCLPAHRGEEVTDEVLDGEQSLVLEEAENRLHAQKAVLLTLMR